MATGWWWPSTASATATLREEVRTVKIDDDSGDVSIRVGEGETTTVHQRIHYNWSQPDEEDVFSLEDDVLVLTDCGWQCDVDYEVVVPRGTAVQGQVNSGDIDLTVPDGTYRVDGESNSGER
ncbi:MAG: hypothetical protein GEU86_05825 [Actinophytocola sp.]|nr:hypothetical protein [Actinophytocola sp.]